MRSQWYIIEPRGHVIWQSMVQYKSRVHSHWYSKWYIILQQPWLHQQRYSQCSYKVHYTAQGFGSGSLPLPPKLWTPSIVVLTPHLYCQLTATSWPGRCGGCMTRRPSPSPGCSAGVPRTRATAWQKIRVILYCIKQLKIKFPELFFPELTLKKKALNSELKSLFQNFGIKILGSFL